MAMRNKIPVTHNPLYRLSNDVSASAFQHTNNSQYQPYHDLYLPPSASSDFMLHCWCPSADKPSQLEQNLEQHLHHPDP